MKMKTILAVAFALVGGAAFADQILVGPTVERAKEMDGQLASLTKYRDISSAPVFPAIPIAAARGFCYTVFK